MDGGPHLPAATCVGKCNIGYPQPVFRTGLGPGVSPFNHICLALLASELHCVGRALSASGLKCVVWLTCIPSTLLRYARSELNYVARWGARKGLTSRASAARGTRVVMQKKKSVLCNILTFLHIDSKGPRSSLHRTRYNRKTHSRGKP